MITLDTLTHYLFDNLNVAQFKDYCPNGLQVEGKSKIHRIVTGVTACQALIDAAIEQQADAILVHHGYFWKGEAAPIIGMKQRRIKSLLANDISLLAYHLPLDAHPTWGNNAQLAAELGIRVTGTLEPNNPCSVLMTGELDSPLSQTEMTHRIAEQLNRVPTVVGEDRPIQRIAWCTGGGQGFIEQAVDAGVDAFISGEISEPTVHVARERGVQYFAAGHHATERYGAKALGEHLSEQFNVDVRFIDIDSPA